MKIKTIIQVFIFLSVALFKINAQVSGNLNTMSVSELDAIQLPSGTWIAASMENISDLDSIARVVIYRSIDNGSTWSLVETIETDDLYTAIADPVMSINNEGNPHLLLMQKLVNSNPTNVHLTLYVSTDDGLNWSVKSQPYLGQGLADTPHLLIDELNSFFISYTEYRFDPFSGSIHFIKSEDGGVTWTAPLIFKSVQSQNVIGSYLNFSKGGQINLVYNDYSSPFTYFTSSTDNGVSWSQVIELSNTIEYSVNKLITNKNDESICVFTHKAHNPTSGIYYNYSINNGQSWGSYCLAHSASMAEGFIDDNGSIHITYNEFIGNKFLVNYMYSTNGGVTFSNPLTLFSGKTYIELTSPAVPLISGESQSMILGNDNMIHLTFIDWTDFSKAKHLIFKPFISESPFQNSELGGENDVFLFPNPAADYINISLANRSQFSTWDINTIEGKRLNSGNFNSNKKLKINTSNLESGTYLLKTQSDTHVVVNKFLKR